MPPKGLQKGGPRLLVTDRESALYLERARIQVEGDRVVYHIADDEHARLFNIPHVNLAVLFMGQGTSITQSAMRLLGDEKVHLAVTGSGGSPLHMGAMTTYGNTHHFRDLLPIYLSEGRSLDAAISIMRDRSDRMRKIGCKTAENVLRVRDTAPLKRLCDQFDERLTDCEDIQQLLGFEGSFAKACYKQFAKFSSVNDPDKFRRQPGTGQKMAPGDLQDPMKRINRLIDHGNYLCYGMAGAALWALGIPPHMAVLHGKTRAGGLVFDLADAFKDAFVLPLAFRSVLNNKDADPENTFRAALINQFNDKSVLKEAIASVDRMIAAGEGASNA